MIRLGKSGVCIKDGTPVTADAAAAKELREKTLAYTILRAHDRPVGGKGMHIGFDAMISHDITYVGIIQTARASGMTEFPIPYALTNCHNSLCAVGGTINEDDHAFGLSAAMKYGGIYVPANQAVIHQYARERLAKCGGMVLGSDSHTRYGCYGAMGVGEGGGELAKQLLKNTWDIAEPEVVLIWLEGAPKHGVGPHDVALALVGATFDNGFVKNKIMEFAGPGVKNLPMDYRIGIDVMTTETSCLSSIWETDETVRGFYENVGRAGDYRELRISEGAYYDALVTVELDKVECMIALPFHPSKAYTIHELQADPGEILARTAEDCKKSLGGQVGVDLSSWVKDGKIAAEQGVIVGCAGGMYDNLAEAAAILEGKSVGDGYFDLSVYPSSTPIGLAITDDGTATKLYQAGAVIKPAFCGPCFGAGDTPAHNGLSIRHATRNFANREGSRPSDGQIAYVALMDARSIAATAVNGGILTAASDIEYEAPAMEYKFNPAMYEKRCYEGFGKPRPDVELRFGPNIADWPAMPALSENLLVRLCAVIHDDVTTTDELIPSGETSSYRSNPIKLSEFVLSRRVPEYVPRSKAVRDMGLAAKSGELSGELRAVVEKLGADIEKTGVGSCVFAKKPGDGSAREQAASCQKVLGGFANICFEYATKRYRSNCINWGIVPFTMDNTRGFGLDEGDWIYIPDVRGNILGGVETMTATALRANGETAELTLTCAGLTPEEREILADGCLINYYAGKMDK